MSDGWPRRWRQRAALSDGGDVVAIILNKFQ